MTAGRTWDAVVVGAGPAGSAAARELARRGLAVLLVDRAPFPRWKVCGCCLNARALALLAGMGLGGLAPRCGAVPLGSLRLATIGQQARVPLAGGVALSRTVLDAALADAAVAAGAEFWPGTHAALAGVGEDRRWLSLRRHGREMTVGAGVVLAADGLGGKLVAHETKASPPAAVGSRIGAGAVADDGPAFYERGTVFMACGAGGYLGLVRLEDGRLDLAAALDPALVRRAAGPAHAAAALLREVGWPVPPDLAALEWRGTPAQTRQPKRLAAERLFVIGDAAGYVEPFTGEGMAWALAAAAAVAPLAARAAEHWEPSLMREWASRHRSVIAGRQGPCRVAAQVLRRPALARAVVGVLARFPGVARPVVRYLNAPPARAARR